MKNPGCPRCGKDLVRRIVGQRWLDRVLEKIQVHPFRCQLCTYQFRAWQWGAEPAQAPTDQRQYERVAAQFPITFSGNQVGGAGTVKDISMGGCGLETDTPVQAGQVLQMQLRFSEQEPPVTVKATVVRPAKANSIGVEFINLEAGEKARLGKLMQALHAPNKRPE